MTEKSAIESHRGTEGFSRNGHDVILNLSEHKLLNLVKPRGDREPIRWLGQEEGPHKRV